VFDGWQFAGQRWPVLARVRFLARSLQFCRCRLERQLKAERTGRSNRVRDVRELKGDVHKRAEAEHVRERSASAIAGRRSSARNLIDTRAPRVVHGARWTF
jgi:hypothetical protein